jgi:hypothetical protein
MSSLRKSTGSSDAVSSTSMPGLAAWKLDSRGISQRMAKVV